MRFSRYALAASILLGGLALSSPEAEALPIQPLASATVPQARIQDVYYGDYRGYGWRRPVYRRGFSGYGWRRPYYAGRPYGYHRRRDHVLGSPKR